MAAGGSEVPQVHRRSVDDGDHGTAAPPAWPVQTTTLPTGETVPDLRQDYSVLRDLTASWTSRKATS